MKASEVLGEARDELYLGWAQGNYVGQAGTVCAIGAIERVALKNMAIAEAGIAENALQEKAREIYNCSVQRFNDNGRTLKEHVLELFDKTINGLEEIGS